VGAVAGLRTLDHGRLHKARDQDPFADKNAIADYGRKKARILDLVAIFSKNLALA
jgi:hypothetical protein